MNVRFTARRYRRLILTDDWQASIAGLVITGILTLYVLLKYGLDLNVLVLAAGSIGGFVTGVVLGTNSIDGSALGFRAGVLGGTVASFGYASILFAVWFLDSGQVFAQFSFMFFALIMLIFAPLNGITGALGGAFGTILRRTILPGRYNPPPY